MKEKHAPFGEYLKDAVYAANDGVVTTFAVVAGVAGANLSPAIVLIIGFANLLADGFAMAIGNYLGTKSEQEYYQKEERVEKEEIEVVPEEEAGELNKILTTKGYAGEALVQISKLIMSKKQFWADLMMHDELKLFSPNSENPIRNGLVTFIAFVVAGALPLVPYILSFQSSFAVSIFFTGATLFLLGALRRSYSQRNWLGLGLEMLVAGGFAAAIAYGVGFVLKEIFSIAV